MANHTVHYMAACDDKYVKVALRYLEGYRKEHGAYTVYPFYERKLFSVLLHHLEPV